MSLVSFLATEVIQTLFRVFPFPGATGLVRIGNPDRNSPVLLTCNFRLTVARVRRALRGVAAYLLVANSRGVKVWCAATGGLLTDHDAVSVLKTSGIHEDRRLLIELDEERCRGAAFRERVCPTRVFEMDTEHRMATLPRANRCVQCGACIVQCPFDALLFRSESGGTIAPETVRRFKLDLIGRRIRAPDREA